LLAFFDRAFDLAATHPDQGVLKYSAARISKMKLGHHDLILAEDLLMQCARVEAGSLAYALAAMLKYPCRDKNHEKSRQRFMTEIIQEHAPQRHSSESDEVDEYISRIARSYEEDDWWSVKDDDVTE
jgi:hypothetical protein